MEEEIYAEGAGMCTFEIVSGLFAHCVNLADGLLAVGRRTRTLGSRLRLQMQHPPSSGG